MSEARRGEFHTESLIWDWVSGQKEQRMGTVNASHGYRAWLSDVHGFDRSNSLTCFFQHSKHKDKDTMRETVRKKGSDRNPYMKCRGGDIWKVGWEKKVMGDRRCKGRSYLAVFIQGLLVARGLVIPVTSTDVQRHSWRNHIAKHGESKVEWTCVDKIRVSPSQNYTSGF